MNARDVKGNNNQPRGDATIGPIDGQRLNHEE